MNLEEAHNGMWGAYRIGRSLGQGYYGEVREGVDNQGQRYAIKRLTDNTRGIDAPSEISLLLQSSHPHLIKGKEYFFADGCQHLVMELADMNLEDFMQSNPEREKLETLFQQMLQGLSYLQENGFRHCDIKPANILLLNGEVKLADLGLSTYRGAEVTPCQSFPSPQNYYANKCEYARKHKPIFKQRVNYQASDIWALGVTFVYMLTGKILFYASTYPLGEMSKFIDDPNLYLRENLVDESYLPLLNKMLHPDQRERTKLAKELLSVPLLSFPPIFYSLKIEFTACKNQSIVEDWLKEVFVELELPKHEAKATLDCFHYVFDELTNKGKKGKMIQCLACACLLLMSKSYSFIHIGPEELTWYSKESFTKEQLFEQERAVFDKLGGRVYFY